MAITKSWNILPLATLAILAINLSSTMACTCSYVSPESYYCSSDFVILARVQNITRDEYNTVYAVEIEKSYKVTPEGQKALEHNRFTVSHKNVCGVRLQVGVSYVIAANESELNLCSSFVDRYQSLSVDEKNGFSEEYRKGCN